MLSFDGSFVGVDVTSALWLVRAYASFTRDYDLRHVGIIKSAVIFSFPAALNRN